MIKIKKVINNNIVVIDDNGQEAIIMGRGLGFKKKRGEEIDPQKIDKKFYPQTHQNAEQLISMLNEISLEEMEAASQILSLASNTLSVTLNDTEIISLSDHIHNAIVRGKEGIFLKNNLLWDIKHFYPKEYEIGIAALEIIKKLTDFQLNEDEAGFITMHIVDAQIEKESQNVSGITKFIQEVTQILKYACHQEIDENSLYYYRFITHLKYLAQRIFNQHQDVVSPNKIMLKLVEKQYPQSFSYAKKVTAFNEDKYNCQLSGDELMYLTLHIEKMVQQSAKN